VRGRGAVFDLATSALTAWDPVASGRISSVAFAGNRAGIVGQFDTLQGQPSLNIGVFDAAGRLVSVSTPCALSGSATVAGSRDYFYFGSSGPELCGPGSRIIATTLSGTPAWTVGLGPALRPTSVDVLARYPDLLVAGGQFSVAAGGPVLNLALFRVPSAGPPTQLTARVTGQTVSLSWSPPSSASPQSYLLDAGTAAGASNVGQFPLPSTGLAATVGAGTYYVRVRALVNGTPGEASSEMILTVPSTPTAPQPPAALTGSVSGGVVSLSWGAAAGNAESYVIEAGTAPGLTNLAVFDTGVLDTQFLAPVPSGTYYVRIRGKNANGLSGATNEVMIVVP
jgi:hypothetical protein